MVSVNCSLKTIRKTVNGERVKRKVVICIVADLPESDRVRAKLTRGMNRLWKDGGLMYAPPVR